jgi:hypothetical protein
MKHDPARDRRFLENGDRFYRKWNLDRPQRIACILTNHHPAPPETISRWLRDLANEGHQLWVFAHVASGHLAPRHLNIRLETATRWVFAGYVLWRILTKKKRFRRIVVWDIRWGRLMQRLRPFHRARLESPISFAKQNL